MKPNTNHRDAIGKIANAIDSALVAAVDRMDEHPDDDLDTIIINLAEARAYTVKAGVLAIVADNVISVADDRERIYGDQLPQGAKPKPLELPKLKPQGGDKPQYKRGISKLFKGAINFDCPTCGATEGTFCFKFTGPGTGTKPTTERNDGSFFHVKRADLGKAYNDRIRKANVVK